MGDVLQFPLRTVTIEQALPTYASLTAIAESLHRDHGLGTDIRRRVCQIVWAKLNSCLEMARFEQDTRWEAMRARFTTATESAKPHRQPTDREVAAQTKMLCLTAHADVAQLLQAA